jgi:hypothetical protein
VPWVRSIRDTGELYDRELGAGVAQAWAVDSLILFKKATLRTPFWYTTLAHFFETSANVGERTNSVST